MTLGGDREKAHSSTGADGRGGPAPIDLDHLSSQTLGDPALLREILEMFSQQLETQSPRMRSAGVAERRQIAHALVGSARGVGAFALARCAAEIEARPDAEDAVQRFAGLAGDVRDFIRAMERGAGGARC